MADSLLDGRRILVVEDEYFLARDLAWGLVEAGAIVVGPAPSLADALTLLGGKPLDGAVLDINLGGESVYPLASELAIRDIPFVFLTGYDIAAIPPRYATHPHVEKPVEPRRIAAEIGRAMGVGRAMGSGAAAPGESKVTSGSVT